MENGYPHSIKIFIGIWVIFISVERSNSYLYFINQIWGLYNKLSFWTVSVLIQRTKLVSSTIWEDLMLRSLALATSSLLLGVQRRFLMQKMIKSVYGKKWLRTVKPLKMASSRVNKLKRIILLYNQFLKLQVIAGEKYELIVI